MKIQCPQCGQTQNTPAQFCNRCGVQFVVQPKKKMSPFWFVAIVITLAIPVLCCGLFTSSVRNIPPANTNNTTSQISSETNVNTTPQSPWEFSDSTDKMTSKPIKFARVESLNKLEFDFPYQGGATGTLTIRRKNGKDDVMLSISKGQFLGNISNRHDVSLRFDEQKPITVSYDNPSDGDSDMIFLGNENRIINELKKASTLKIEVEFFREGNRILEFNVKGFKW
jgi:hypothetical protein